LPVVAAVRSGLGFPSPGARPSPWAALGAAAGTDHESCDGSAKEHCANYDGCNDSLVALSGYADGRE